MQYSHFYCNSNQKCGFILLDKKSIQFLLVLEKSLNNKTLKGQMYFENSRFTVDFFVYTMLASQLVMEQDISVERDLPAIIQFNCLTTSGLTKC